MEMTPRSRAIDKIFKRRNRYEIPDWQRGEVWDRAKKQRLIDSILRGWKLPKFYFLKSGEDAYEVVDGQQRLNAIYEFFENDLPLNAESQKLFGGPYYRDLKVNVSDAFDETVREFRGHRGYLELGRWDGYGAGCTLIRTGTRGVLPGFECGCFPVLDARPFHSVRTAI